MKTTAHTGGDGGPGTEPAVPPGQREELRDTVVRRLIKWHGRREPLVCNIAEGVAADLIFGTLKPGAELNSVDLAARFQVSRTPVREALMLLEQEGLVVVTARKRARVASPSQAEVREIYGLRGQLLAVMVRELVAAVTDEQLLVLTECVSRLEASVTAGEVDGYFRCHVEFQDMMTEFAGNRTLKRVLDSLALRTLVLRHVSASSPGRMYVGAKEQRHLLEAIASRDADLAAAIIAHSTRQALATVERAWGGRSVTTGDGESGHADPADEGAAGDGGA
jgi:DNA-binding GntR family transcriptional regulator